MTLCKLNATQRKFILGLGALLIGLKVHHRTAE
ncbi:hypothetical protein WKK_06000 [Weissella koreensis KACC 15510]|nr:hypothetical protein WKK_06000 [Weissella koreensis KACC 15510]